MGWLDASFRMWSDLTQMRRKAIAGIERIVTDSPHAAVARVQLLLFLAIHRACADSTEDGNLIAGFVDRSIAIDATGDGQRMAFLREFIARYKLWSRTGAEAVVARCFGGSELHDPQSVLAVR